MWNLCLKKSQPWLFFFIKKKKYMNQTKPCFRTNGAEFQTGTKADEEGAYW
jgi:hypothetical protein